ncbi:MAG: thiolase domain-containing protein [Actinobacteria bacterium]|nr:thiolase domain-containing protein [Actinomycetota bacterium]
MREVAIIASAQADNTSTTTSTPVEMLIPVIQQVLANASMTKTDIGFWCHGSCDYMTGQPFSFVSAVDALGAWPPIIESHVEADGAFALYEAWMKIQTGEIDTALVFGNGRSSSGDINRILTLQLDPYVVGPLWPDDRSIAAMQARACLESGVVTERAMAEVAQRSHRNALTNPKALRRGDHSIEALMAAQLVADPLRELDCPAHADGVTAVIIAAGDRARSLAARPAWIRGIDHRIESQNLGNRSMTSLPSAALAAHKAGVANDKIDVAELHAPYSHQELLLTSALGLSESTTINPSGGALCANPMMSAGLARFAEAATRVMNGTADRAIGHASSGPWMQQNLVCVLEGE